MPASTDYLDLLHAATCFPGDPSFQALWRWCRNGIKTYNGHRVYLQHIRTGKRIYTTRQWCEQFQQRLAVEKSMMSVMADTSSDRLMQAEIDALKAEHREWNKSHFAWPDQETEFKEKHREIMVIVEAVQYLSKMARAEILQIIRREADAIAAEKALHPRVERPKPTEQKRERTAAQREADIRQAEAEVASWTKPKKK